MSFIIYKKTRKVNTRVLVNVSPSNAQIYLDGRSINPNRWIEVEPGFHTIEIFKPGFESYREGFEIHKGERKVINITLRRLPKLIITSKPLGADVLVDDVYIGRTPIEYTCPTAGVHTIRVSMNGFEDFVDKFFLNYNDVKEISVKLIPKTTKLIINVFPSNAKIFIDDELRGIGNVEVPVTPGRHIIKVFADNYVSHEETIYVNPGETKVLNIKLRKVLEILNVKMVNVELTNDFVEPGTETMLNLTFEYTCDVKARIVITTCLCLNEETIKCIDNIVEIEGSGRKTQLIKLPIPTWLQNGIYSIRIAIKYDNILINEIVI